MSNNSCYDDGMVTFSDKLQCIVKSEKLFFNQQTNQMVFIVNFQIFPINVFLFYISGHINASNTISCSINKFIVGTVG